MDNAASTNGSVRRAPVSDRRAATFSRGHSADTPAYPGSFWRSSCRPPSCSPTREAYGKPASHSGRLAHSVIWPNGRPGRGGVEWSARREFIAALTAISGIGPWTALGALLIALQREDVVFLATWRCARPRRAPTRSAAAETPVILKQRYSEQCLDEHCRRFPGCC